MVFFSNKNWNKSRVKGPFGKYSSKKIRQSKGSKKNIRIYVHPNKFCNQNISNKTKYTENDIISKADITEPKFAINGSNQDIVVTAKEGNFVGSNKILLKKNVKFQSSKFIIKTNNVIFDRKNQSAISYTASKFNSENTEILSEGFDIYDNGSKIKFFGNATIILE